MDRKHKTSKRESLNRVIKKTNKQASRNRFSPLNFFFWVFHSLFTHALTLIRLEVKFFLSETMKSFQQITEEAAS